MGKSIFFQLSQRYILNSKQLNHLIANIPIMKLRPIHLLLILTILYSSCRQTDMINPKAEEYIFAQERPMMVLGKKLDNPYSVENMQRALENLKRKTRLAEDLVIEATDLYVKFMPFDSLQLEALEADTTLHLFEYPFDYEIEEEGNWYHDPDVSPSVPTYQYTVVKTDYVFPPTISYEIVTDLFLVDNLIEEAMEARMDMDYINFLKELEDEALRITNNWEPRVDMSDARWNPQGRVTVQERINGTSSGESIVNGVLVVDKTKFLPVKGIRVRARRWFKIETDQTNANGEYKINSFVDRPVNYSLISRTELFRVTGWTGYANRLNGPKKMEPWNLNFTWHSEWWARCTVMNAIYDFREQAYQHNLALPYGWDPARIRVVFESGRSNTFRQVLRHEVPILINNDVKLYTKDEGAINLETDDLYSLVMHELGHVSHYLQSPGNAILTYSTNALINESFAEAVQYEFTKARYPFVVSNKPDQSRSKIEYGGGDNWKYSPYFIDLMDNTNQFITKGKSTNSDYANDRVSGYTLRQFQVAMDHRTTLHGIKQYLRENYSDQEGLNELTDFYQAIKDGN